MRKLKLFTLAAGVAFTCLSLVNTTSAEASFTEAKKISPPTRNGIKNYDKIKLQEFYGSVFGQNKDEVKKSSQRLRFKIYRFGFIIFIIALLFYFFIFGKINFGLS